MTHEKDEQTIYRFIRDFLSYLFYIVAPLVLIIVIFNFYASLVTHDEGLAIILLLILFALIMMQVLLWGTKFGRYFKKKYTRVIFSFTPLIDAFILAYFFICISDILASKPNSFVIYLIVICFVLSYSVAVNYYFVLPDWRPALICLAAACSVISLILYFVGLLDSAVASSEVFLFIRLAFLLNSAGSGIAAVIKEVILANHTSDVSLSGERED